MVQSPKGKRTEENHKQPRPQVPKSGTWGTLLVILVCACLKRPVIRSGRSCRSQRSNFRGTRQTRRTRVICLSGQSEGHSQEGIQLPAEVEPQAFSSHLAPIWSRGRVPGICGTLPRLPRCG